MKKLMTEELKSHCAVKFEREGPDGSLGVDVGYEREGRGCEVRGRVVANA